MMYPATVSLPAMLARVAAAETQTELFILGVRFRELHNVDTGSHYSGLPRQWHTLPRSSSPMSKQSKLFFPSSMTCSCSMETWVLSRYGGWVVGLALQPSEHKG